MRITMRSLVAAATVAGLMAFGAGAAQAHDSGKKIHKESTEVEIEVGDIFAPEAEVEDSEFVQIDQSYTAIVTNVEFGDMVLD